MIKLSEYRKRIRLKNKEIKKLKAEIEGLKEILGALKCKQHLDMKNFSYANNNHGC